MCTVHCTFVQYNYKYISHFEVYSVNTLQMFQVYSADKSVDPLLLQPCGICEKCVAEPCSRFLSFCFFCFLSLANTSGISLSMYLWREISPEPSPMGILLKWIFILQVCCLSWTFSYSRSGRRYLLQKEVKPADIAFNDDSFWFNTLQWHFVNSCPDASILAFWSKRSLKKLKRADQVPQLRVWDLSRIFPSQPELPFLGSIPLHHHLPHLFPPSPRLRWICLPFENPPKVKQWSVKATEELFLVKNFKRLQMTRGGRRGYI